MRERTKLVKVQKERKKYTVSKRLGAEEIDDEEAMEDDIRNKKRKKVSDGASMMGSQ